MTDTLRHLTKDARWLTGLGSFGRILGRKGIRFGNAVRCRLEKDGVVRIKFLHPDTRVHILPSLSGPTLTFRERVSTSRHGEGLAEHVLHAVFPQGQRRVS